MTVQEIFNKFKTDKPSAEILMIINVNGKAVISAPSDDTNEFDTLWVIKNNEIIPYSPIPEMMAFQKACEHPLFKKEENSVQHHGIKGMHWGIRRFDYVPVGRNSKKEEEPAPRQTTTSTKNDNSIFSRIEKAVSDFKEDPKNQDLLNSMKTYSEASKGHGAGPVDFNNMHVTRSSKDVDVSDLLELPKGSVVLSQKIADVNPRFWTSNDYRRHNNCPNCTLAVEMRKRGYTNFQANANYGLTYEEILDLYKGEKSYTFSPGLHLTAKGSQQAWMENVTKYAGAPGSHGFISGWYKPTGFAGGHILNYTVLKDGTIQIEDGQSGMIMTLEAAAKVYNFGKSNVTDMTNAKMDYEKLDAYNTYNKSDESYVKMREARQNFGKELVNKISSTVSTKMKDSSFIAKGAAIVSSLLKKIF